MISIITTYAAMKYNGSWENTLDAGKKYGLKVVFINIYGWNQTASSVEFWTDAVAWATLASAKKYIDKHFDDLTYQ